MKRFLTLALCMATIGAMSAQKQVVDQAKKLAGKTDKIEEARALIKQAMENPETANQANTYVVAAKIEQDAYDKARTAQMINPNDDKIDPLAMSTQLINGYNYYMKALPLDSIPNEKGQVKPKFSKDIIATINANFNDFFNAGGQFYNNKKYYPEAYEAFMIYGNLPKWEHANKTVAATPDSVVNMAFFNAGLSAYAGNALKESAEAFKAARKNNSDNPQNYIYEIACWQYLTQNDSTLEQTAKDAIEEIAYDGYNKFGLEQMLFINNLINAYVNDNKYDQALALVNDAISKNPDNANLYGLQGFIYDRMNQDDKSLEAYRKAASFEKVDAGTLLNAARKVFQVGTNKYGQLDPNDEASRMAIKNDYFEAAKSIAERAKTLDPDNSDVNYILENIDYVLTTYYSNN